MLMYALSQALMHSIWQIALIAGIVWISLRFVPQSRARARYNVLLAGLYLVPISFLATLMMAFDKVAYVPTSGVVEHLPNNMRFVVLAWALGFGVTLTRLLMNWREVQVLRRQPIQAPPPKIRGIYDRLIKTLAPRRAATFGFSDYVRSPCTIGFFRPLILLPTACLSGMSVDEIEAILAHELAHVRRHDFLHRCAQSVIESVFYYHPALHYLSKEINKEREHACDDLAVSVLSDAKPLATGLLRAGLMSRPHSLVLSAQGADVKSLQNRVTRLVSVPDPDGTTHSSAQNGLTAAILGLVFVAVVWFMSVPLSAQAQTQEFDRATLTALKDEVCEQFHTDNIYWNPTYDKGGPAHVKVNADGVYMNGVALPASTQKAIKKTFKRYGLSKYSVSKLKFSSPDVKLTLKTIHKDEYADVRTFSIAGNSGSVVTDKMTVPLSAEHAQAIRDANSPKS